MPDNTAGTLDTPVPSSEDVFAEAFAQASGVVNSEPVDAVLPQDTSSEPEVTEEAEDEIAEPDTEDQLSEDSENSDEELSETTQEVLVKGKDGKRRKIKVDFSDKDKLVKYVQKAANATRLQSERDAALARIEKLQESESAISNLQSIVDERGFEGLIDQLNVDNGGYEAWIKSKLDRHEQRQHASEDEIRYLDEQEKNAALQRRLDLIEQRQIEREERVSQETEQAELDRKASEVNPIYFKYSFDGKLGDSVVEQRHNKAMYREVMERLDELADNDVKITKAVIEKEFKSYVQPFMKSINKKVRQNISKALDRKKKEATTHAQAEMRKASNTTPSDEHWVKSLTNQWLSGKLKG